jgi:hypothetical protein
MQLFSADNQHIGSDSGDLEDHWYTIFALYHRHTTGEIESFHLEDPNLQGTLPITKDDLRRVVDRTHDMTTWIRQFESASGNPISVIAVVGCWVEGDNQTYPRMATTYWLHPPITDQGEMEDASLELLERFQREPLSCPIIKDVGYWDLASRWLFADPED